MQKRKQLTHFLRVLFLSVLVLGLALPRLATAASEAPNRIHLPVVSANACAGIKAPTVFGVQMYGGTGRTSSNFQALQDSTATWVRVPIDWQAVEPNNVTPRQYNWTHADAVFQAATDGCVNIIATIDSAPGWAADEPRAPIYPAMLGEFRQFVQALVERYDGDGVQDSPTGAIVLNWEFYNEPDHGARPNATGWGEAGDQYAAMLKEVYPAIKQAAPAAQVIFGGLAHDNFTDAGGAFERNFLDDVLEAGGGPYFDVMNFHYYPAFSGTWANNNGTGLPEKTASIRATLDKHGHSKPIVVTEAGWHSDPKNPGLPSSEEIQSLYVAQLYTQATALGLDVLIWWTLNDLPSSSLGYFGLVHDEFPQTPKPSLGAFRTAHERLRTAVFAGALGAAETQNSDLEVYRFEDPSRGRTFYAAWLNYLAWKNPTNVVEPVPLVLPGKKATVYDQYNRVVAVKLDADDGATDGKVKVQVGGVPLFIVSE